MWTSKRRGGAPTPNLVCLEGSPKRILLKPAIAALHGWAAARLTAALWRQRSNWTILGFARIENNSGLSGAKPEF
jgi:hypothetical protein